MISFGFFIFLACDWTNVKSELGEAFGAAVFVAFFTVIFFFLSIYLKPYLDPYDPVIAKVLWVGGLICSGPLAIKTTYGETILNSVKTFLIAAILTAIVVGIAMLMLNALNVA